MAEQRNGFVVRKRKDGERIGYGGGWHTFPTEQLALKYIETHEEADSMAAFHNPEPVVEYIGPDAPMWRDRPTCAGEYNSEHGANEFSQWDVDNWGKSTSHFRGQVFGPIPEIPEVTR